MSDSLKDAPGKPGSPPTWSSSAKDMISTALGSSRLWATFGYGIVNEIYWPSTGQPQMRDLGFIVAGPRGWTEVKRAQRYSISMPKPYVPLPRVVHQGDDYRLELEFLVHPLRDALLIRYRLDGDGLKLYPLLSPHLSGNRDDNSAWAGEDLTAQQDHAALCLRSDGGFERSSAGYVGVSDGWQDFNSNGRMTNAYPQASNGNVALMGELTSNAGTLSLAFAETVEGARTLSRSSLAEDYGNVRSMFVDQWEQWARTLELPNSSPELEHEAKLSAAVIKMHEDRTYSGAVVASLSVPWGNSHDDPGGYHLVWTRDAVEAALAMIVVGQTEDAARTLAYLVGTQGADGSWGQNYFPDGNGYWEGIQLDEVALPILLTAKLRAVGNLEIARPIEDMVRRAVGYIVRNGPMTDQDRWEENAGASPFTLGAAVCALVASAEFLSPEEADYTLSLADCWNERIESWTYVTDSALCAAHDVAGHYIRISPRPEEGGIQGTVQVRNVPDGRIAAAELVGMEFLFLVRCGLRAPDDPHVLNTLKVVDVVLRRQTPSGDSYYRYNGDGYGEHDDGTPFDGQGRGRLWPLLTGERGHYEFTSGGDGRPYLEAMARMTGPGGLLPEQIWDGAAVPSRGLEPGRPSGSAMPLVWAHAEFLKLLATQASGRATELLDSIERRYGRRRPSAQRWHWRVTSPFPEMPRGRSLLVEMAEPFALKFVVSETHDWPDRESLASVFGMHQVEFAAAELQQCAHLGFTLVGADGNETPVSIDFVAGCGEETAPDR